LSVLGVPIPADVIIAEPLAYRSFLSLESQAAAVLTDSGGVQEEATGLGVPCFTLRANTERPVTITDGTNVLLGLEPSRILEIPSLLRRGRPTSMKPPLWDGRAGERAAEAVVEFLAAVGSGSLFGAPVIGVTDL
jgi:UDP-N-acetylglucosamine 2-epimerase (non-hydrolysing)